MALPIPTPLIEFILLGPQDDRRQLQDTPILGDVWVEFGKHPDERVDLLIAPYKGLHAGSVAAQIDSELTFSNDPQSTEDPANVAFLQGLIVARLNFEELMRIVVPKTRWWIVKKYNEDKVFHQAREYEEIRKNLKQILDSAQDWHSKTGAMRLQELPGIKRFLALMGLIFWAGSFEPKEDTTKLPPDQQVGYILEQAVEHLTDIAKQVTKLLGIMLTYSADINTPDKNKFESSQLEKNKLIWQVSRNRPAMPAISKSVPAVKADAAKALFKVNCSEIVWAVIDSGIDARHPAFLDNEGNSRVKRSFDFKNFRKIVSLSNSRDNIRNQNLALLLEESENLKNPPSPEEGGKALKQLAEDARLRAPVHWELVERFVEIKDTVKPPTNHGTHVAGIIGASKLAVQRQLARSAADYTEDQAKKQNGEENIEKIVEKAIARAFEKDTGKDNPDFVDGMCPDISLYDFRVLGPSIKDAEFAIIAALQFIRYLNSQDGFLDIHGANLSLSIPHDVRNFACGRTPICDECEQLIASGVVVVAAAGNHGYKSFETKEGSYDSYAAFSITDPGNADNIITVGATHRFWPHTYGVSFFSSRGPTGDGRMKPDLVAPGERIRAPLPGSYEVGGEWGELDGTSMAAPHVSGAAAMLMARYSELVGRPLRIKRILCDSATDLGRERSFQGNGMLDVLRAFQSI